MDYFDHYLLHWLESMASPAQGFELFQQAGPVAAAAVTAKRNLTCMFCGYHNEKWRTACSGCGRTL